jgi:ABC-type dipeptide/oligopeptide/nickel transport system permease component
MIAFVVRRLGWTLVVLLGIMVLTFAMVSAIPGDLAVYYAGPHATPQILAETRHTLGLDRPKPVQFLNYLWLTLHGDFGHSATLGEPVTQALKEHIPYSALLAATVILFEMTIAFMFGTLAALKDRGPMDRSVAFLAALGVSLPGFWIGIMLIFFVGFKWGILPLGGFDDPHWKYLILPAATQGVPFGFWYARILKVSLRETLFHDYCRTARSKGIARWTVVLRHAPPNAILPIITIAAMDFGQLLGGIVVVETVFAWPGIGLLADQALQNLDVPLVMGTVVFTGICIALLNILADLLKAAVDPRIRLA